MSRKFETREEAAIYMIQNPGVEVVSEGGTRYRWHLGSIDLLNLTRWWPSTMMDEPPYTLPEPEPKKEELPELGSALREVLRTQCCASCTEHFFRVLLAEAEARAKRIADERIEAASVVNQIDDPVKYFKLKRGES